MTNFATIFRIAIRRSVANWRLMATVLIGVLFSAALMSTVVLYSDTVRDLGLRRALEFEDPFALDLKVSTTGLRLNAAEFVPADEVFSEQTATVERTFLDDSARFIRSATFFPTEPDGTVDRADNDRPRAHFQTAESYEDHVNLVEGRFPEPVASSGDANTPPLIEVAISKAVADAHNLSPGITFDLHPFWRLEVAPVEAVITGVFDPIDPEERYWARNSFRYDGAKTSWPTFPLFVSGERDLIEVIAVYLPTIDSSIDWFGFVDTDSINSRNASEINAQLAAMRGGLQTSIPRTGFSTQLPDTIEDYQSRLFFTRLPLFALMLQVVGITLYYLVMVGTMLQERQIGEIALLRSRGASVFQVVGIAAVEGALICALAVILGPLIAVGSIALLGITPPFEDLSQGEFLRVPLTQQAFLMAALGAALAFIAFLWPAYRAANRTMIDYKSALARPALQPLFLRYYLDLVLIGASAFAFYQLRQRGSLVTERLFGDLSADPILLISPTLFMLMVALVFIRIFPVVLRVAAYAVRGLRGPTVALGTWQMVRNPMQFSRLILLLLLATAVGMFAAGFRATLERSYDDRAAYEAVSDGRIADIRTPSGLSDERFISDIQSRTGADHVVPVIRMSASYSPALFRTVRADLVAFVPSDAEDILFWRDDFGGSLGALMDKIEQTTEVDRQLGPAIPDDARFVGAWVSLPTTDRFAQPWVRLRDENGFFLEYRLMGRFDDAEPGDWNFYVAELARPSGTRWRISPSGLTLDAVFVRMNGPPPAFPERATALFDDLQVSFSTGSIFDIAGREFEDGKTVEDFESIGPYELITGASAIGEPGSIGTSDVAERGGGTALRISYTRQATTPPVVGMRIEGSENVLPVIVDQGFMVEADVRPGDELLMYFNRQYIRVRIEGGFDLFPPFDPESGGHAMLADSRSLTTLASAVPVLASSITAEEAWLGGAGLLLDAEQLREEGLYATTIVDRATLRGIAASDPLVAASWEGILFLSFTAVLALTALGFSVYAVIAAKARALEFAILRTMGYTSRQILALVTFEQLFVITAGMVMGTALGFPLGRFMLDFLGVTETGADPLPPLTAAVSWSTVLTVYFLVVAMFVVTILALATTYSRIAVARALRIGEV